MGFAEILPSHNAQYSTWQATHIVVVEEGKVLESWKGNLKAGDKLPKGAVRFTEIPKPGPDPWRKLSGEPEPVITGKRMVLFLSYELPFEEGAKKPVWMGAAHQSHPFNAITAAADVVWVEGDRVYSSSQSMNAGGYALQENGGVAALKQRVDIGLALQTMFHDAKKETDDGRRAERIVVLAPLVDKYAGYYGKDNAFEALGRAGVGRQPFRTS